MAKDIKYNMDARDLLKKGVDQLANAVKVTLQALCAHRSAAVLCRMRRALASAQPDQSGVP